jgi:hypothetical protein
LGRRTLESTNDGQRFAVLVGDQCIEVLDRVTGEVREDFRCIFPAADSVDRKVALPYSNELGGDVVDAFNVRRLTYGDDVGRSTSTPVGGLPLPR